MEKTDRFALTQWIGFRVCGCQRTVGLGFNSASSVPTTPRNPLPSSYIHGLFAAYRDSFPGDHTWTDQVQRAAADLLTTAKAIEPDDYAALLSLAAEVRKNLGDDLKPISTVGKMFNGTFWSNSHPAPSSREEISMKNGKTLLIMVNSRR